MSLTYFPTDMRLQDRHDFLEEYLDLVKHDIEHITNLITRSTLNAIFPSPVNLGATNHTEHSPL